MVVFSGYDNRIIEYAVPAFRPKTEPITVVDLPIFGFINFLGDPGNALYLIKEDGTFGGDAGTILTVTKSGDPGSGNWEMKPKP